MRPHALPQHTAPAALPAPDIEIAAWTAPWSRLLPLWRYAVWLVVLFAMAAMAVSIRLDVQDLQKDLQRSERQLREARVLQKRLQLEWDVRRRTASMEAVARDLGLQEPVAVIPLEVQR